MEANKKEIKKYFCQVLKVNLNLVTLDFSPNNTENWDSLNHLNLIMCFEEKYGMEFEPEEIIEMYINYGKFESHVLSKFN